MMSSRRHRTDPYADPYSDPSYGRPRRSRRSRVRRWVRRHRVATSLLSVLTIFVVGAAAFALWVNSSLGNIERIPVTIDEQVRPTPTESDGLNILMLGTDAGSSRNTDGRSILQDAASGSWPTGKYRSDATLVVHIPDDKDSATVMSIPRDSYVPLYDDTGRALAKNKINAALSLYGPSGAISTVENLTHLRLDHVVMIDWDGFTAITDALGGVTMTTDTGRQTYSGAEALAYVRQRKTVEGGDLGRVKRQQNYLRAILREVLTGGTRSNPIQLRRTVDTVARNVAVDDDWSTGAIRSLAFSMRNLAAKDVRFLTVPTAGTDSNEVGSVVLLDQAPFDELFASIRDGDLDAFLDAHPELMLPRANRVD